MNTSSYFRLRHSLSMKVLLRRACHATNLARERRVQLKPRLLALIDRQYDAIVTQGMAFHDAQPPLAKRRARGRPPRRVGHNLLLRLSTRKPDVLRFLADPRVPFTNNLAKQDARMMKLRQKISGGLRCDDGAQDFAVVRSVLSTARKQAPTNNDAERVLRHAVIARRIGYGTRTDEGSRCYAAALSVIETCRKRARDVAAYASDLIATARLGLPHPPIPLVQPP